MKVIVKTAQDLSDLTVGLLVGVKEEQMWAVLVRKKCPKTVVVRLV
jgi:hypothetical protein